MKTILVTGSRGWTDKEIIRKAFEDHLPLDRDAVLIHGTARGADQLAEEVWLELGMPVENIHRFPAKWGHYGKRAGYMRNLVMASQEPDVCLAFHMDNSSGTGHMINICWNQDIDVDLYTL